MVEQFYAAVNEAIVTGNLVTLRHVVTPSFADENPLPGAKPGRTGLEDYLVSLHHTDPSLRLEAEVISASADQVIARVQVRHEPSLVTLPTALGEQTAVWSPIEVFRVADGMIVRRWGHTDGLTLARPLAQQQLELPIPTPRDASAHALEAEGGHTGASQRVMLTAGKSWLAPAGTRIGTMNVGSAEAQLLAVTFSEPHIPNEASPEVERLSFGVEVQVLAGDLASTLETGSVTVIMEQIALAPDAGLTLSSTEGPILVAVETGQLEATVWGTAWVRRSRDGMSVASRGDVLTTENGMLLQPNGVVALRTGEQHPAHVLVVRIRRMDAEGGSSP